MKSRLIIFTKSPLEGKVKTRMQPVYSTVQSLKLHQHLLHHTLSSLSELETVSLSLYCTPTTQHDLLLEYSKEFDLELFLQQGSNLGERMFKAISGQLKHFQRVIIIGTDCPAINPVYIQQANVALEDVDVVIGPASDGGYVLLGIRGQCPDIFSDIDWGSEKVLMQTRVKIADLGLKHIELDVMNDIDRPEDLDHYPDLKKHLQR